MSNELNKSICNYLAGNPNNEELSLPTFLDIGYYDTSNIWQSIIKNSPPRYLLADVKEITEPSSASIESETYYATIYTFKIEANEIDNTIQFPTDEETGDLSLTFVLQDNSTKKRVLLEADETTSAGALSILKELITDYSGNALAYMLLTWQIIVKNSSGTNEQWEDLYQRYELDVNNELKAIIGKEGNIS